MKTLLILILTLLAPRIAEGALFSFVYPLEASRVSSEFGPRKLKANTPSHMHQGVDIPASEGTCVRAAMQGVVVFAGYFGSYGNFVVLRHSDSVTTHYGHLKEILMQVGDSVLSGDTLGLVGSTGEVTGPHLHFEVRVWGKALDPQLVARGFQMKGQG